MKARSATVTVTALAAGLLAPSAADADVVEAYDRLAERKLNPPPLVPVTAPRAIAPVTTDVRSFDIERGKGYGVELFREGDDSTQDARVLVTGGEFKNVREAVKFVRTKRFKVTKTRVRGKRGYLFARKDLRGVLRVLVWSENGVVHTVESQTPKKVSLKDLRATATGLEPLVGSFVGSYNDTDRDRGWYGGVVLVATTRTVSIRTEWGGSCSRPEVSRPSFYDGDAIAAFVPRAAGDTFSFDVAGRRVEPDAALQWNGAVNGSLAGSPSVQLKVGGVFDGFICDIGPFSVPLAVRADDE